MNDILLALVGGALVLAVRLLLSIIWPPPPTSASERRLVDVHRTIASFNIPGMSDLPSRLGSRAIPNARLVEAYGISNSFTTMDESVHLEFLASSKNTIHKMDAEKWLKFSRVANTVLERILNEHKTSQPLFLAQVVRVVVFVAILDVFFDVEPERVNLYLAEEITDFINRLWVASKEDTPEADRNRLKGLLQLSLVRMLPDCFPCTAEKNPLNTIIPAYETMWRVVLLTYVSAGFRRLDPETTMQFRRVFVHVPKCFEREEENKEHVDMALDFAKVS
ncbi:hypothetical protein M426DRAFT_222452 [Hypoxylon sp. CI-4A]|nr:hypothetical protein M426DRAFT_222452 [Hypoxylon sp. CI-4A]